MIAGDAAPGSIILICCSAVVESARMVRCTNEVNINTLSSMYIMSEQKVMFDEIIIRNDVDLIKILPHVNRSTKMNATEISQ